MNKYILVILLAGAFFSGCSRKEDVVAYVGRKKITASDFRKRLEDLPSYYLGFIETEGGKRQYLSGMIREEILIQKALDENIDELPDVARRLADARREVLLLAAMNYLQKEKIQVSDQELKDYYEQNKDKYENPQQVKVSHILVSDEKTAREIIEKLKKGASFERLAREYSIDTFTAINGGDMGYLERGDMDPDFEKAVFNLDRVGQISDVIKSVYGYHIVKLTGRKTGDKKSFDEAKEEIRERLEKEKFSALLEQYRRDYNVRVNYDTLDSISLNNKEENPNENNEEENRK